MCVFVCVCVKSMCVCLYECKRVNLPCLLNDNQGTLSSFCCLKKLPSLPVKTICLIHIL